MDITTRHKREQKALMGNITAMKKQATKKTRKSVLEKCESMQRELDERHRAEVESERSEQSKSESNDETQKSNDELTPEDLLKMMESTSIDKPNPSNPPSQPKRNRQKERLARREAEIQRIKDEAANEAANQVDYRQIEMDSMNQILQLRGLTLHEVKPDGHCLFASIQDQLKEVSGIEKSIQELRELAASHIDSHRDDYIPFLFDENTGEIKDMDAYLDELVNTPMWGSDMEILALSRVFGVKTEVYMAGAQTITINDGETVWRLGYYKKAYGLGEHYNSLRSIDDRRQTKIDR